MMEACKHPPVLFNETGQMAYFKDRFYRIAVPFLMALSLTSVAANVFVVFLAKFMKNNQLTPAIRLCLGLAAADAWTSAIMGTGFLLQSYLPYVVRVCLQDCLAYLLEGLRLGAILTSVLHLLFISLNHYMAITRSSDYKRWISPTRVWVLLILMWVLPALGIISSFGFFPDRGFRVYRCIDKGALIRRSEFLLAVNLLLFIPLITLIFVYILIVSSLQKMDRQFRTRGSQQQTSFIKNRKKMIQTALLIVGSFVFSWIPGGIWYLVPYHVKERVLFTSTTGKIFSICISVFTNSTMVLKGLINPAIYALRVPEFKDALTALRKRLVDSKRYDWAYNSLRSIQLPIRVPNAFQSGSNPRKAVLNTTRSVSDEATLKDMEPLDYSPRYQVQNGQPTLMSVRLIDRMNVIAPHEDDCML